jgi:putative membrane protein
MMNHLRISLGRVSLAGLLLGLAACSHEHQTTPPSTAHSPSSLGGQGMAQQQPTMAEQYGSAMNQPGGINQSPTINAPPAEEQPPQGTMSSQGGQATQGGQGGAEQGTGGQAGATTVDVSSLNDAQVAAVVNAINAGEIKEAQLAGNAASMPQVRQFARQMLVAHQNTQNRLNSVYSQIQTTPSPNAISNQIDSDSQNQVSALQSLHGRDFDRVYLDDAVRSHNSSLELVDRMMPNVQNAQLKTQLKDVRSRLEAHLKQAETLQQQVQQGGTNNQAPSTTHRGTMNVSPQGNPGQMR